MTTPSVAFERQALEVHGQIDQLTRQSAVLAQARDMLLPRLMNGEITV